MIVTFISECEKKAHKRTRRVLDAFANRIGTNTWQTVITTEGLDAVKKLLNKTATKNTAVSCHKIKSRKLTELLWIVGNKDKFNTEGFVAVNYTEQDFFIGEINMNEIYANSKKQPLDKHLFAVGVVAQEIMKTFTTDQQLQKIAFIAGIWHDIGKLEAHFQDWLTKELKKKNLITDLPENGVHIEKGTFSWEKYPTHNEVSTLLYEIIADDSVFGKLEQQAIKHAIYWHHAEPIRGDKNKITKLQGIKNKLKDNNLQELLTNAKQVLNLVNKLINDYFDSENELLFKSFTDIDDVIDEVGIPKYKTYNDSSDSLDSYLKSIKKNAKNNLVRTAVITADRLVSVLNSDELEQYIENKELSDLAQNALIVDRGLNTHIQNCLDGFNDKYPDSERNKQQQKVAKDLADEENDIAVLQGPAGCGKTKIALEFALNISAKQIIWVCPRVAICQSLFNDLSSDEYLPNANIEIHTGEFKYTNKNNELYEKDYFAGDIVLTTIDQIINSITTHKNITTLTKFMNAAVVFDEFHEYIPMSGFNILFTELIECKKLQQNDDILPNTLLVSATPNYYFVENFLELSYIETIESFNNKPYDIILTEYDETLEDDINPLYEKVDKNTFVISNTAITAQKSYIQAQDENSILAHSKFTPEDRKQIFANIMKSFGKNGNNKFDVIRSGPLIQAALNISAKNIISEISTAEDILQRLGRNNRFADDDSASFIIVIDAGLKSGKQNGNTARFLNKNHQLQSTKAWFEFLNNRLNEKSNIAINELYQWYKEFYQQDNYKQMIEQDFIKSLKEGLKLIEENIFNPKRIKYKKSDKVKLKKYSLRGNSRFVQMAIYDATTNKILNEYLTNAITLGVDEITNYGDDENVLNFMVKKHHNIKPELAKESGVKDNTKYKGKIYLNKAVNPELPIYASYTPEDLDKIKATAEKEVIYYVVGKKQAIGVMAIKQLKDN